MLQWMTKQHPPEAKDDVQDDSMGQILGEKCDYEKLLVTYNEENFGELPSKTKTTMR